MSLQRSRHMFFQSIQLHKAQSSLCLCRTEWCSGDSHSLILLPNAKLSHKIEQLTSDGHLLIAVQFGQGCMSSAGTHVLGIPLQASPRVPLLPPKTQLLWCLAWCLPSCLPCSLCLDEITSSQVELRGMAALPLAAKGPHKSKLNVVWGGSRF